MATNRWMKFWPQEWESNERLKVCSLSARGLWIAMMCLMHRAEPYGHLLVNGKQPSPSRLAALVGATVQEVSNLLTELETEGVFGRHPDGSIYSRQMIADKAKSDLGKRTGIRGGNPNLIKTVNGETTDTVDREVNGRGLTVSSRPTRAQGAEQDPQPLKKRKQKSRPNISSERKLESAEQDFTEQHDRSPESRPPQEPTLFDGMMPPAADGVR